MALFLKFQVYSKTQPRKTRKLIGQQVASGNVGGPDFHRVTCSFLSRYCRFYLGRRTEDDRRQVDRWKKCAGDKGRWRNNLITKIVRSGCAYDNFAVSPVVRQTLQHWAYKLNKEDFDMYSKEVKL